MHILNGTANNHTCRSDYSKLRRGKNRLLSYSLKHPRALIYVSPSLEHGCKRKAVVMRWYRILRGFLTVCSTYRGYCPSGLIERHGASAKGDIASNDGSKLKKLRGKLINFVWHPCMNGRKGLGPEPIAPKDRLHFCSSRQISLLLSRLRVLSR